MLYNMFHGKIHRATVTEANLEYMGSITIDSTLMKLAGILPGERVQIVDNNNGARLETYVIEGEPAEQCGSAQRDRRRQSNHYCVCDDDAGRSTSLRAQSGHGG